jgi:hypothetical protein
MRMLGDIQQRENATSCYPFRPMKISKHFVSKRRKPLTGNTASNTRRMET